MSLNNMKIKLPNTLTFRLTLWYASAFVAFLITTFFVLCLSISANMNGTMNDDMKEDIAEFKTLFANGGIDEVRRGIGKEVTAADAEQVFIKLFDGKGNQIFASDMSHWKGLTTDEGILQRGRKGQDRR